MSFGNDGGVSEGPTSLRGAAPSAPRQGGPTPDGRSVWVRLQDALTLKAAVFKEIGADPKGVTQGFVVATVAAAAGGILTGPLLAVTIPLQLTLAAAFAGVFSLAARLFSQRVPPYSAWLSAALFATAPSALGVIPMVGLFAAGVYTMILEVVAIRGLAGVSAGSALVVFLTSVLLVSALLWALVLGVGMTPLLGLLELWP